MKSSKEEDGSIRKRVKRESLIPVKGGEDDEVSSLAQIDREPLHGYLCDYREVGERKLLDEAVHKIHTITYLCNLKFQSSHIRKYHPL